MVNAEKCVTKFFALNDVQSRVKRAETKITPIEAQSIVTVTLYPLRQHKTPHLSNLLFDVS